METWVMDLTGGGGGVTGFVTHKTKQGEKMKAEINTFKNVEILKVKIDKEKSSSVGKMVVDLELSSISP